MGQKVSPHGFRVGVVKDWDSMYYASQKDFPLLLKEDTVIREFINKKYKDALISRIVIKRTKSTKGGNIVIDIYTGRPGVLIGQKGAGIEALRKELDKLTNGKQINVNIKEIKNLDFDAQIVAQGVATQIEKRVTVKRAIKASLQRVMKTGAQGCKILVSGRIDGREIAGNVQYNQGSIPLHTLRANIDYATATAHTTYGAVGVKVWIYKGEILDKNAHATPKQGGDQ